VEAYANQDLPDDIRALQRYAESESSGMALGTMTTTGMVKKALAEGQLACGSIPTTSVPLSSSRLAMTQQTAFSYGQAWPDLVWVPISYFYDSTIPHQPA